MESKQILARNNVIWLSLLKIQSKLIWNDLAFICDFNEIQDIFINGNVY